jgi:hypothetical protein
MAIAPAPQILALRESLGERFDRYLAAAGEPLTSGADVTEWLLSQLPGADPELLGWAVLTVAGLLYPGLRPERTAAGTTATVAGQNMTMLIASRVGEALIEAAEAPRAAAGAAQAGTAQAGTAQAGTAATGTAQAGTVVVGRELSLVDLTEAYADLRLPAAPDATAAQRRHALQENMAGELAEIRTVLTGGIAGIDLTAAGWALTGTGMCILVQTSRVPAARRARLTGRRRRHDELKNSAMRSAMLLAVIGDFLVNPPVPPVPPVP